MENFSLFMGIFCYIRGTGNENVSISCLFKEFVNWKLLFYGSLPGVGYPLLLYR